MQNLSDRALKERVTGAVVLVVFAVLVVPIFLDGPSSEEEIVSATVTLPGQNNQERKQQTIVLDRDRSEPVPVSRTPVAPQPAPTKTESMPEQQKPDVSAPAKSEPAATPAAKAATKEPAAEGKASATGMWAVQLGSFSAQDNAERLAASLRDQGYAAFLSQVQSGSGQLHRVRIGPQKDRASAEAVAAQLAKGGHKGQVVPHP
jgi:DedD protein